MARARVCDRCNKTIMGKTGEYYEFGVYRYYVGSSTKEWRPDLECELCNECIDDFKDFIKNNEKK